MKNGLFFLERPFFLFVSPSCLLASTLRQLLKLNGA